MRKLNCIVLIALLLAGCDSKTAQTAAKPPPAINGNGIVRGRVLFSGIAPEMKEIPNKPCHEGAPPIKEETVLVDSAGGLKNVLVCIEGAGPGAPRGNSPTLDQIDCRYVPHVIGVTAGQEMVIRSSDATVHNVHISGPAGDLLNLPFTKQGTEKRETFDQPAMLRVKCDVHPWMTAYIAVVENPLFAVTSDDGSFEIKNIPAGTYTLSAWHEQYGQMEQKIVVTDEKAVDVTLNYKAP